MSRHRVVQYSIYIGSLIGYIWLSYFTERRIFFQVITLYGLLFLSYGVLLKINTHLRDYKVGIFASILFRIALLFALPNLSDDFYRFIWDGRLVADGENPFVHLPTYYMNNSNISLQGITQTLFNHLNSPNYFTIYPPVSQYIFLAACKIFPGTILGSVVIMRGFIFLAEMGNFYLLDKLTSYFQISKKAVLVYALNPLVIVELTGNLHFEAIMIFFLLFAIYLLAKSLWRISAISFGLSVGVKLLPLIFLPFLLKRLGFEKSVIYCLMVALVLILLFLPFLDKGVVAHLFSSISLYFQKFEFNASIYYLIRWIGYKTAGYNVIAKVGGGLGVAAVLSILVIASVEKRANWASLPQTMLWAITCYFAFAPIVHPWYITTLIAFSVFSSYRYAVIWSALIPLTYITYQTAPYKENLGLVSMEYLGVVGWLIYETQRRYRFLFEKKHV